MKEELEDLKKEVNEISEKWIDQIYGICEKLDYHKSSAFSYHVDRLKKFVEELNESNP
jgi:hypothetical protein